MLESQDFLGWVWIGGLEAESRMAVAEEVVAEPVAIRAT
jgi:hypothetical protein